MFIIKYGLYIYMKLTKGKINKILKKKKFSRKKNKNKYEKWFVKPQDGMMILFPSKLEHCVEINKSCNTRISLSFNLYTLPIQVNKTRNVYSSKKFYS